MTLYKQVDGQRIQLTQQEELNTYAYWDLTKKYPYYSGSIAFDGINPPEILIEQARINHKEILSGVIDAEMKQLNQQIEIAQEDGLDVTDLFSYRKFLRSTLEMDLTGYNSIDELIASVPDQLKKYWEVPN